MILLAKVPDSTFQLNSIKPRIISIILSLLYSSKGILLNSREIWCGWNTAGPTTVVIRICWWPHIGAQLLPSTATSDCTIMLEGSSYQLIAYKLTLHLADQHVTGWLEKSQNYTVDSIDYYYNKYGDHKASLLPRTYYSDLISTR